MDLFKPLIALLAIVNPIGRLIGLILAALAVEVMSDGLVKLFPALVAVSR